MSLRWVAPVLACLAAFAAWLAYIGYFGGAVFTEVPAAGGEHNTAVVLFSGDMGFKVGMGPKIAQRLATDGMPVLGVSSLAYFRQERTPAEIERLIEEAAKRAMILGHAKRLILVGQSFGADMLHVGLARAPQSLRAKIGLAVMVVPTDTVFYRASPSELFNWSKPDAQALPTARQLTWVPLVCVQGEEETDSLCPLLHQVNVTKIVLPGGHPLHRDDAALYAAVKTSILRTIPDAFGAFRPNSREGDRQ